MDAAAYALYGWQCRIHVVRNDALGRTRGSSGPVSVIPLTGIQMDEGYAKRINPRMTVRQ